MSWHLEALPVTAIECHWMPVHRNNKMQTDSWFTFNTENGFIRTVMMVMMGSTALNCAEQCRTGHNRWSTDDYIIHQNMFECNSYENKGLQTHRKLSSGRYVSNTLAEEESESCGPTPQLWRSLPPHLTHNERQKYLIAVKTNAKSEEQIRSISSTQVWYKNRQKQCLLIVKRAAAYREAVLLSLVMTIILFQL